MFVAKTVPVFGKELAHVMYTSYTEYENPLVVQDSIKYLIEGSSFLSFSLSSDSSFNLKVTIWVLRAFSVFQEEPMKWKSSKLCMMLVRLSMSSPFIEIWYLIHPNRQQNYLFWMPESTLDFGSIKTIYTRTTWTFTHIQVHITSLSLSLSLSLSHSKNVLKCV